MFVSVILKIMTPPITFLNPYQEEKIWNKYTEQPSRQLEGRNHHDNSGYSSLKSSLGTDIADPCMPWFVFVFNSVSFA